MNHSHFLSVILAGLLGICAGLLIGQYEGNRAIRRIDSIQERLEEQASMLARKLNPQITIRNASVWTQAGEVVVEREPK